MRWVSLNAFTGSEFFRKAQPSALMTEYRWLMQPLLSMDKCHLHTTAAGNHITSKPVCQLVNSLGPAGHNPYTGQDMVLKAVWYNERAHVRAICLSLCVSIPPPPYLKNGRCLSKSTSRSLRIWFIRIDVYLNLLHEVQGYDSSEQDPLCSFMSTW